jgi:hypothetical protein
MKFLALVLLIAAATPALAGNDFPFSNFRNELDTGVIETALKIEPSADYLGTVDLVSGLNLALDRTPIDVLAKVFDVAPQTYQRVGYTTTWVCFTDAGRRVWYLADTTYETRDDIYVSAIIDEPADPAIDALFLCTPDPKAMLKRQAALPMVGATLAELSAFYKIAIPEGTRFLSGYADTDDGEESTTYISKAISYRLTNGVVDAISIAGGYFEDGYP